MTMNNKIQVKGTKGYAEAAQKFTDATIGIDFFDLHREFIDLLPKTPSYILDVGAGIGRDAWEFSKMGHCVTAVEPTKEYHDIGRKMFGSHQIEWIDDSLPSLNLLESANKFDVILASGVFHHLEPDEQNSSIRRVAELLKTNGIFLVSLRNGPAGIGTHVFQTNSDAVTELAASCGLELLLRIEKQPSLMTNKANVTWSKLAFRKTTER
jgi:2-polyprenyl-3-methyl-5-hydroxy-6-metoxy-1,4-benzoquinol methylase